MAPEVLAAGGYNTHADESPLQYDAKCDIFAFGRTLQYANVFGVSLLTPELTSDASRIAEMLALAEQCCSNIPADRPTAESAKTTCLAIGNPSTNSL
jgi:hypothetical protein